VISAIKKLFVANISIMQHISHMKLITSMINENYLWLLFHCHLRTHMYLASLLTITH